MTTIAYALIRQGTSERIGEIEEVQIESNTKLEDFLRLIAEQNEFLATDLHAVKAVGQTALDRTAGPL